MSAQAWVDEECRRLLSLAVPRIVQELHPYGLQVVFLGGSASLGEAVGWEDPAGERLLLSDLDLGAIVARPVPAQLIESLAPRRQLDPSGVSLGCYEARFLSTQVQMPGMADLAAAGLILWGDQSALQRIRTPSPDAIPIWEAYRLVGNRCLELDAAEGIDISSDCAVGGSVPSCHPDEAGKTDMSILRNTCEVSSAGRGDARALYALAKASTDLWTSWMVARGAYRTGWRERSIALDGDRLDAPDEVLRAARAFRDFRMHPSMDLIPHGMDLERLFSTGLRAWLNADPGGFRRSGRGPEDSLLREPLRLRSRLQLWRRSWGRPGLCLFARRLLRERIWHSTPEGVKMARSARRRIARAG